MAKIIVTDLTRFSNEEILCLAGVDTKSRELIRPMPYLKASECKKKGILPGSVLEATFAAVPGIRPPHVEDRSYPEIKVSGACSSDEFRNALLSGCFESVEKGFGTKISKGQKHIPLDSACPRSIITLQVQPSSIEIAEDGFKPGKVKLFFSDKAGREFRYIPITDLGFHDYALKHHSSRELDKLNALLRKQKEVFIRIGLSREYESPQKVKGYWMQANGIYSFPEYPKDIRSY